MINVSNLNKYYRKGRANEIHVINNTNLSLPDTGLVAILGESGSGKTTLLNVLGGLDKASGTISYEDKKFNGYHMGSIDKYRRENIGYIFQNYNLLPNITVYENLSLALELIGIIDKDEVSKRIKNALTAVGLYKFRKKPAGKLSGGQMQRVAIARALVKQNKVLIADEPTGNLDSSNSIEVMNILKKLSEKTLVLLVTHDKTLAEFYSSQIIEIVDGKISNIRTPDSNVSLQNKNDTKVYLKDMNQISDGDKVKSVVFSSSDIPNIDITLVEKNGTFYIKSNVKIKLLSESPLELIDDHYHDTTVEDVKNELKYDDSSYDNSKKSFSLKRFFVEFYDELKKFFVAKKKQKFIRFILVIIGVILGFMAININRYMYNDYTSCIYDDNIYTISRNKDSDNEMIADVIAENSSDIKYVGQNGSVRHYYYEFEYKKNSFETNSYEGSLYSCDYKAVADKGLICGSAPSSGEAVIGKKLADKLLKKMKLSSYSELLKYVTTDIYKISGVSKANTMSLYSKAPSYEYNQRFSTPFVYMSGQKLNTLYGSELTEADVDSVYIVTKIYGHSDYDNNGINDDIDYILDGAVDIYEIGLSTSAGYIDIDGKSYKIKGVGSYQDESLNSLYSTIIFNNRDDIKKATKLYGEISANSPNPQVRSLYEYNSYMDKINIIAGKGNPTGFECIVPANSIYNVGDEIVCNSMLSRKLKVVGVYTISESEKPFNTYRNLTSVIVADNVYEYLANYTTWGDLIVVTDDKSVVDAFENKGLDIVSLKKSQRENINRKEKSAKTATFITIAITFGIALVYIYFTMRAKIIADVYEVGVLRNIGASRFRILSKYLSEIFIITTFTTMIGYICVILGYGYVYDKIKKLSALFPSYEIISSPISWLGIIVLYAINMLVGIIPTVLLLMKTPSEISSKYDI